MFFFDSTCGQWYIPAAAVCSCGFDCCEDLTPSATPVVPNQDFFRSYGSNRGIDFTTSNPLGLCSNPINSDKYEVLMHKLALTHFQSHNGGTVPPNDYHLKEYLPIERQVRFVDITETSAEDTIWLVAWYTTMSSNALTPLEELQFRHRTIVHFRDPIN